ncbi:unnamed protein product [Thlaspi arvense]|uniref:Cytochrome P450 n=1 Tax=Thlaspi arvense TaxID=13288 RepID=A0AAU9S2M7_THLAR|nr:unnamed protein product [Thlaspi arvense]
MFTKPKNSRGCDLPPSPPSLPIIGHLHLLLSSLTHKSLQKLSSKYGPLLHIRIFSVPIILVSSASMAYEIFRAHDVNVSSRGAAAIDESLVFGSSGIVNAPYGDYWKFMKKLMATKLLRPQALERSRGVRAEELQRFYGSILNKARKNEKVEIAKEAMILMNNILCRMSMGRSFSEENGEAERVRGLVNESYALTKKIFLAAILRRPLEKLGIPLFKKDIMSVSNRFSELLERILVEHKEKLDKDQDMDMMDMLMATYGDENAEYMITRNHIKSFFVELFVGGTDTSVQTTQWTMAEIMNNPNVLERLREEIDSVVGKSRLIQETDIPNLPYLQAVIKEGLRLHTPSPLLVRTFQEKCEIKGFYIPEKTILVINAYAVMRDPDSWEDPNEFKPERFLGSLRPEQEDEREQALKYMPFGSGRRGCPGSNLAYTFVGIAIGVMVQCFDWRNKGDKVNMEETFEGMSLTMVQPLKCTPLSIISFQEQNKGILNYVSSSSSFTSEQQWQQCSPLTFKTASSSSSSASSQSSATLSSARNQRTHEAVICLQALRLFRSSTLSSKYGPLLHIRIFSVPIILVSSASMAYEIFRAHDVNVSSRGVPAIDESLVFGSSGFFTAPYGDYWKFMKKLMATKLLRPQALEQSRGVRAEELQRFYESILNKARKSEKVEIGKEAMILMTKTLCRMSMGRTLSEENGEAERVRGLVNEVYALTKKIFLAAILRRPLEKLGIQLYKKDIMTVSNRFSELLERMLVEHKEKLREEHQGKDMMDVLLAAYEDEDAEYKITRNHIKSFLVELFVGGTDTSVQTTQWTMAEIINSPTVLERLREEIDSVVGLTRLIQETDLPNLPYLQAVVKEGLRLHPPSPLSVRTFQESCEIKGFYIREKTVLVVNAYAVMRDPDSWEDANEFKPERFLGSSRLGQEDEREQALKYMPFSSGRRGCPGTNLAYVFVGIAIGVMVQCFDWRIKGDKVNMEETVQGMNLTMVHPLTCTPVPRTKPFFF